MPGRRPPQVPDYHNGGDRNAPDNRDDYEPFEILTRKFFDSICEYADDICYDQHGFDECPIRILRGQWLNPLRGEERKFTLKCKGKFKCSRCREGGELKSWTTGVCTINLHVTKLNTKDKQVEIFVKGWSQECNRCDKAGDIGMYQDEVDRLSEVMAQKIVNLYYRPPR